MRKLQLFDSFMGYRNETVAENELTLHTNVFGNLIKPMLCFHGPKTSESQKLSDVFNGHKKKY